MSLVFNAAALQSAVGWVVQRLPKNAAKPVTLAVMIDPAVNNMLPLAASDGGEDARAVAPIQSGTTPDDMGRIGVPGHALAAAVKACHGDTITVEFKEAMVEVSSAGAEFLLPKMDLTEHPMGATKALAELPEVKATLTGEQLHWIMSNTGLAAGKDPATPQLCGVKMLFGDGKIRAAATDRMILGAIELPYEDVPQGDLLIPAAVLKTVTGHIPKDAAKVSIRWEGDDPSKMYLSLPDRAIAIGLLGQKSQFPDYERIIPNLTGAPTVFVTETGVLKQALKQALVTSTSDDKRIEVGINDGGLALTSVNEAMFRYTGTLDANRKGEEDLIELNLHRLNSVVSSITSDLVVCAINGASVRLSGADLPEDSDTDFLESLSEPEGQQSVFVLPGFRNPVM